MFGWTLVRNDMLAGMEEDVTTLRQANRNLADAVNDCNTVAYNAVTLGRGCKLHPSYRGVHRPQNCQGCDNVRSAYRFLLDKGLLPAPTRRKKSV